LLRRRYQDLLDAPQVSECLQLPDRKTVNEVVRFNRAAPDHGSGGPPVPEDELPQAITPELKSDADLSLMRAVEKFDYGRGFKFSTGAG
jgi:hypothetical protein